MENVPDGVLIFWGLVLLGVVVLIVVRYAKQILTFLLVAAGVVCAVIIAWVLFQQPGEIQSTSEAGGALHDLADIARVVAPRSEPAPAATTAGGGGGFVAGVVVTLIMGSLAAGGYFFARWKLAEMGGIFQRAHKQPRGRGAPVIYVVQEGDAFDEMGEPWALEDLVGWDENELLQF